MKIRSYLDKPTRKVYHWKGRTFVVKESVGDVMVEFLENVIQYLFAV
jgi:hypothetical protein